MSLGTLLTLAETDRFFFSELLGNFVIQCCDEDLKLTQHEAKVLRTALSRYFKVLKQRELKRLGYIPSNAKIK